MLYLIGFLLTLGSFAHAHAHDLEVRVENVKNSKGNILYILFNQEQGFPDDPTQSVRQGKVKTEEGTTIFQIKDLPPGEYALSVIHDENDNDKLDTNLIGIPKEGFGFSNNPKIRFGAPGFEKCRFGISSSTVQKIELKHF